MFPTSYKLSRVERTLIYVKLSFKMTELWMGKYGEEIVALRILRVRRNYPQAQVQVLESVSMPHDSQARLFWLWANRRHRDSAREQF